MASGCLPTIFEVSENTDSSYHPEDYGSDLYDTDLEDTEHDNSKNGSLEDDGIYTVCKEVYIKTCYNSNKTWMQTQTVPQTRVIDTLETKTINLQYRSLGPSHMIPLARSLKNNMRVERLVLDSCDIQGEGMKYLAEGLVDNVTVNFLNLANNGLGTDGAKWTAYLLLKNKFIKHVILSGNKFGDETAKFIGAIIEVNGTITNLDLSHNEFRERSGQIIGAALGENCRLETLRLGWNSLRNQGAVAIGQSLQYNDTLKVLDVNMNGFGYGGCLALKISLKANTSLRELDISNNSINWKGAQLISEGIRETSALHVLRIGRNNLTTTGCMDLVEAASHATCSLKLLDIQGVSILEETELLAAAIGDYREFRLLHGGIVGSPDRLGVREDRHSDHMSKLIMFIKTSMTRPLELLRDFDKTTKNTINEEEFVRRMVKVGVPLHKFQMRELARDVCSNTTGIDYKKLSDAIANQIVRDRMRIYQERDEQKRQKVYNHNILEGGLPSLDIGSKGVGRRSGLNSETPIILTNREEILTEVQSDIKTSFPKIFENLLVGNLVKDEEDNGTSRKSTHLSLSAPLGEVNKTQKLKKKKKKVKKPIEHPPGGTCVEMYT